MFDCKFELKVIAYKPPKTPEMRAEVQQS